VSEEKKNIFWKWFERVISSSALIVCLTLYWKIAVFTTEVRIFMLNHKEAHIILDKKISDMSADIQLLTESNSAITGKPLHATR
jgi:hypothetical protein